MKKALIIGSSLLAPALLFAQVGLITNFQSLLNGVIRILNWIIPFLVVLAVFLVIWGAFLFVTNAGDPEKRKEGRDRILWGIVGIVVMLSIWGLVNILRSTFGLNVAPGTYPQLPLVGGGGGGGGGSS